MERKKLSRLFSVLLTGMMLINTIPTPAIAEEPTETADPVEVEEPAPESEPIPEEIQQEETPVVTDEVPVILEESPVPAPEETPAAEQEELQTTETEGISEPDAEAVKETDFEAESEETEVAEKTEEQETDDSEEKSSEEEVSYPAVSLSETVEGVTVTLTAPEGSLPEGVTMTVVPVHDQAVFNAVNDTLEEKGKTLSNAVAFDITLHDRKGNELQPNKYVTVSFSNTYLNSPDPESSIDVFRVSDDASEVTPVTTVAATDNNQMFITDHFTIYVSGKGTTADPNGDGSYQPNHQYHSYYLLFDETITLESNESSPFYDSWYLNDALGVLEIVDENPLTVKNVSGKQGYAQAEVIHEYGFDIFSRDLTTTETFWITCIPNNLHRVTFNFLDVGSAGYVQYSSELVKKTYSVPTPKLEPIKTVDGITYAFTGWCSDPECKNVIPGTDFEKVTKNITAYGRYNRIEEMYVINYHGNAEDCTYVPSPTCGVQPTGMRVPKDGAQRPGYIFKGWATSPTGDVKYDYYDYKDVTFEEGENTLDLYAVWEERVADIDYIKHNDQIDWGTCSPSFEFIKAVTGGEAKGSTAAPNPGYRFVRWEDENGNQLSTDAHFTPSRENDKYYRSATYYAVFEPITYTVTFETNGGDAISPRTVNQDHTITKPNPDPKKGEGACFTFAGWYSDKSLTKPFSFTQPIVADTTVYAKWNNGSHNLTYNDPMPATCLEAGFIGGYTCTICKKHFSDARATQEIQDSDWTIPALGHNWSTVTYEWASNNSSVTAKRTCKRSGCSEVETETASLSSSITGPTPGYIYSHTFTPTCTTPGGKTYIAKFTNTAFKMQMKSTDYVAPLGHDWQAPQYEWSDDNSRVVGAVRCSHDSTHVKSAEAANTTIESMTATCEQEGTTTYHADFTESPFTDQEKTVATPALGHDWGKPTYEWTPDRTSVTATRKCNRDLSHMESKTVTTEGGSIAHETVTADCDHYGYTTYTATFTESYFGQTTITDVNTSTKPDHVWGAPVYDWSEDNSMAYAIRHCQDYPTHVEGEGVETVEEKIILPTCTETGKSNFTATFKNSGFAKQTKNNADVPALGHDWGEWKIVKAPTTSETGIKERTCKRDPSHKETAEISKLTPAPSITPVVYPDLYWIADGAYSSYGVHSYNPLVFTYKRTYDDHETFSHFTGIEVDGVWVGPQHYKAVAGSVVITLNADYLETLAIGKHTLTAYFDDGNAVTSDFYIGTKKTNKSPNTEDENRLPMWALIEFYSICVSLIVIHKLRTLG